MPVKSWLIPIKANAPPIITKRSISEAIPYWRTPSGTTSPITANKEPVEYNGEKIESNLKALYLRYGYNDNNKFIFLSNVLNGRNVDFFTQEDNEYAEKQHIIEFRDTTIFENLYNKYSSNIVDNVLTLNEEETKEFLSMISMWDGKINDMVPETMAVDNKQVWEGESNGKTR